MHPRLIDVFGRLDAADSVDEARRTIRRIFEDLGQFDLAFGYDPASRARAPYLPARLSSERLELLFGDCRADSPNAPPPVVKQRTTRSVRPFFWDCRAQAGSSAEAASGEVEDNGDGWVRGGRWWGGEFHLASALVVPLRATGEQLPGMFLLVSELEGAAFERKMADHGAVMCLIAIAAHERLVELSREPTPIRPRLSPRERESLEWLARGLRNEKIAESMRVALPTVELHLARARHKLGAATREQALVRALMLGCISP